MVTLNIWWLSSIRRCPLLDHTRVQHWQEPWGGCQGEPLVWCCIVGLCWWHIFIVCVHQWCTPIAKTWHRITSNHTTVTISTLSLHSLCIPQGHFGDTGVFTGCVMSGREDHCHSVTLNQFIESDVTRWWCYHRCEVVWQETWHSSPMVCATVWWLSLSWPLVASLRMCWWPTQLSHIVAPVLLSLHQGAWLQ